MVFAPFVLLSPIGHADQKPPPPPDASSRTVKIVYFECAENAKESESEALSKTSPNKPIEKGKRLSRWEAGGPAGASWNAGDLYCPSEVAVQCAKGKVHLELRIGRALVDARTLPVSPKGKIVSSFLVKEQSWRRNLDEPSSAYRQSQIKTAIIRLGVILTCELPEKVFPGGAAHDDFAADVAFVAGFASGE
jgi:hypothetical protein